jgi:hypothetical protein
VTTASERARGVDPAALPVRTQPVPVLQPVERDDTLEGIDPAVPDVTPKPVSAHHQMVRQKPIKAPRGQLLYRHGIVGPVSSVIGLAALGGLAAFLFHVGVL